MSNYSKTGEYFVEMRESSGAMPDMHYHDTYEIYYLDVGTREYFIGDKFFNVSAGDFVLIPPQKLHRTGGQYGLRTLVGFDYAFLAKTYRSEALKELLSCFSHLHISPPKELGAELRKVLKELKDCDSETTFALYLGVLLEKLSKCNPDTNYDEQISKIIKYINDNFAEIDNIEQIASQFFISKFHLCRLFKDTMKMTVIDYLNIIKIKNACMLLESTDKSIQEISQKCGFNSVAYFSNVFKKIMKTPPTKYKKKK